ncbi:hypothetical protein BKA64DRAFT_206068 [Cadophora sp. MPI-SDFR-AT-0126]|nr:hypothetical protein BKA64DRAFT_206068 [Leotiomycetes sp. MPI-SDFR-AT-0126]
MLALHYSDRGSSIPLGNPLSDKESIHKLSYCIKPDQWFAFKCLFTIRTWKEITPNLLNKEEVAGKTQTGGWAPRRGSRLLKIIQEALNEDTPASSWWRSLYTQNKSLKLVIIFGLIYVDWIDNFKSPKKTPNPENDKELKSEKPNPEEEAKNWPTAVTDFALEELSNIALPPVMNDGMNAYEGRLAKKSEKKRKKEGDKNEDEQHASKRPRTEPEHGSPDRDLTDHDHLPLASVVSHIQDDQQTQPAPQLNPKPNTNPESCPESNPESNPNPNPESKSENELQFQTFGLSFKELTECLRGRLGKRCAVKKLGQSPESAIRIDAYGKKSGMVLTFQGQTAKNMAKRAEKSPKHPQYSVNSGVVHSYMLELEEEEEMMKLEYVQGFAITSIQPDVLLHMTITGLHKD